MDEWFRWERKTRYLWKDYKAGATYHVFNRRDDRARVFRDDQDRELFVELMKQRLGSNRFGVDLLAYCLMPNHFHLVLFQRDSATAITEFMHSLMTAYVKRFNRRHGRTGSLFDERFQAKPVETASYLKRLIAYVHANPDAPFDDRWSGHRFYMDAPQGETQRWFNVRLGLRVYGRRAGYVEWLLRAIEEKHARR